MTKRGFDTLFSWIVACACCAMFLAAGVNRAPAAQVKVMTYNIHGTVGATAGYNSTNAQRVAKIVNYYQPDILTINELEGSSTTGATTNLKSWCTNYLTYLGSAYYMCVSGTTDGYNRNAFISKYPITDTISYSLPPRDLLCGTVAIPGTSGVRIFTAHLKASSDCTTRQSNADTTKLRISNWSSDPANASMPYFMCGDLNEDETNPTCTITDSYHPITTVKQAYLNEYLPDNGSGSTKTWSTSSNPSVRFDYILPSWQLNARARSLPSMIDNCIIVNTNAWFSAGTLPASFGRFDYQGSDHCAVLGTFDILTSSTAAAIRSTADSAVVYSELQTVTASFADHFYIEDADRLHGIRVNSTVNPGVGSLVSIRGAATISPTAEDAVTATGVRGYGQAASVPKPWAIGNQDIHGEDYQGVPEDGARGLVNAGVLVKTWGNVAASPAPAGGIFYIDDGSHYPVRVSSQKTVNVGDCITVVGVVGFYAVSGKPQRFIETRDANDVQTFR